MRVRVGDREGAEAERDEPGDEGVEEGVGEDVDEEVEGEVGEEGFVWGRLEWCGRHCGGGGGRWPIDAEDVVSSAVFLGSASRAILVLSRWSVLKLPPATKVLRQRLDMAGRYMYKSMCRRYASSHFIP